ncbi:MAG: hypothetical protein GYA71_08010 [Bacteroidales bacterium]|nr:hypothetical protein [Bacteroidales bacterium]
MIKLQMFFKVSEGKSEDFERMYSEVYVPAMRKQKGYLGSELLRVFPEDISKEISAAPMDYKYQMEIAFETEDLRRRWVDSPEHKAAWPAAEALASGYEWHGYDVAGLDQAVPFQSQFGIADAEARIKAVQSSEPVKLDIWNSRLKTLISPNATLDCLAKGFQFLEGPVWDNTRGCLFFSDVPGNTKYRYTLDGRVSVYRKPSDNSNGHILDKQGRLVACEHHTRRLTREAGDDLEIIASTYKGKKLNSPNDVIMARDGSFLFTDPAYGLQPGLGGPAKAELDFKGVYRVPPEGGEPILIADDFDAPNGIVLSPDEKRLFVVDSGKKHIRVFDIAPGWKITGGKVFVEVKDDSNEIPDGMKIDVNGNIFTTGPKGIWIINNKARLLGRINLPEVAANLNWGGPDRNILYITASTGLYRITTLTKG